ncbi:hypothetical protein BU14_0490s0011 [Porphyra umbilicalis]|uniref:Uncharacterized protein n=1 Tax=Porphyra umbilicalis TaxID=2786 RepID=A0A1X6NU44_PORUM|nr:hypothetical protein BU14_0490s0011 [Porphyra umbilicalis]|eukprot:OSX71913.1 hypothetical protein BU14_0490s0011 [Porphyra umbilicalis]
MSTAADSPSTPNIRMRPFNDQFCCQCGCTHPFWSFFYIEGLIRATRGQLHFLFVFSALPSYSCSCYEEKRGSPATTK